MTLDELEKVAKSELAEDQALEECQYHANALTIRHRKPIRDLARAVLLLAPVVRAAEAWRASWPVTNRQSVIPEVAAVMDAIDTFRRALAEGE